MATLNGVEFGIVNKTTTVIHDNNIIDIPGSDTVVNDDAGYSTGPMQITGHVKNESEFDDFKGEFYGGGDLTLIADPDSGKQYTVYASGNVTELDGDNTYPLTDIVFQCSFFMKYPYLESVTEVTRTKTITSNNQEWFVDDDGTDIKTEGNVDAVPDIQVTGGYGVEVIDHDYVSQVYTVTIDASNNCAQRFTSTGVVISKVRVYCNAVTVAGDVTATLWDTPSMGTSFGSKTVTVSSAGLIVFDFDPDLVITGDTPYVRFTATGSTDVDLRAGIGGYLYVNDIQQSGKELHLQTYIKKTHCKDIEIYNTDDTTIKCAATSDMLYNAIHRINVDGTGTINYDDDFTTIKWEVDTTNLNCTQDITNTELDIADDGYIYWKCEVKYPVLGTPTLTSQTNITAGTPTIQISSDGSTWYDIDTAIVDDVDTEYPLDSAGNLSLAGKTLFYYRFDCVKAGAATCSIKSFELDVDIHTIYAKNPIITKGATASTFRCDQDAGSGMNCEVELIYPARWWA